MRGPAPKARIAKGDTVEIVDVAAPLIPTFSHKGRRSSPRPLAGQSFIWGIRQGWLESAGVHLAALLLLAASAPPAFAHTSERAFILLLPTGYYLAGGAVAVAASFLLLFAIPVDRLRRWADCRWSIGTMRVPSETWTSLASFTALTVLIVAGFLGSRDPLSNPLPLAIWTLWWIGLTIAQAVFGDIWRFLNPWVGPYRLLTGTSRRPPFTYPDWLGYWPAIAGFAAFAWLELIYPTPDDPAVLAHAILLYSAATLLGMALFGEAAWLARGEAFSAFLTLVARISPLRSDASPSGRRRIHLAPPGRGLVDHPPLPPSGVVFVLLTLGTVSFDGLSRTFWWLGLGGINPLEFPGRSSVMGFNSLGLFGFWLGLSAAFLAAIWLGRVLARDREPFWHMAGALAASILPISIGYQFAHYLTAFLVNVQYAAIAMTDPFDLGWFGAEARSHGITTSFLNTHGGATLIWNLQAAGIVAGHVVAVMVAHLITLRRQADARGAILVQAPLAVLMVAYTLLGLWLLSAPAAG